MSDYQIAADTLREDVSGDAELVTVSAADVRAVLARLDELQAMEQRAHEVHGEAVPGPMADHRRWKVRVEAAAYILRGVR